jgi:tripartite-type tricarboxylate transporter receptor subunit TctC
VIWSGFPPGGLGDQVTRPLLDRLKGRWPGTLILDSKPGAGGRIAADFVKRAAPDGATILQLPSSPMSIYPHTYGKKLSYDPLADFIPITPWQPTPSDDRGPGVPRSRRWLTSGPRPTRQGQLRHPGRRLRAALHRHDVERGSVPFKTSLQGGAPLLQDLMGGQIPVLNVVSEVLPHVSGKLRSLAVASPQRWALCRVPTLVELGYKDISAVEFLGWYAREDPPEIVQRLNAAVRRPATQMQDVQPHRPAAAAQSPRSCGV